MTPSHVYAVLDRLDRTLDGLLAASGKKAPRIPESFEGGLEPRHVYKMVASCIDESFHLVRKARGRAIENRRIPPEKPAPKDVIKLAKHAWLNLSQYARISGYADIPRQREFNGKVPSDVFKLAIRSYVKMRALRGEARISPNEVFLEMNFAQRQVKFILGRFGVIRKSAKIPEPEPDREPRHVFAEVQKARSQVNTIRDAMGLKRIPLPSVRKNYRIRPVDVFIQSQILQAELMLLGRKLGIQMPRGRATRIFGKVPTDVWRKIAAVEQMLREIPLKVFRKKKDGVKGES